VIGNYKKEGGKSIPAFLYKGRRIIKEMREIFGR